MTRRRGIFSGTPKKRSVTIAPDGEVHREKAQVIIRKTPVMWGIPCDEVSFSRFWILFEKNANKMPWDAFASSEGTYLPKARNIIHKAFVEDGITRYLMMLDSDILFPPNLVSTLLAHNLPIVGGWYKDKKHPTHHPVVYDFVKEDDDGVSHWRHRDAKGSGIEQVDGMGAGCWLMRREVAVALGKEPYDMNNGGEDLSISRQLMKLGIPLHVDWDLACAHLGIGHT